MKPATSALVFCAIFWFWTGVRASVFENPVQDLRHSQHRPVFQRSIPRKLLPHLLRPKEKLVEFRQVSFELSYEIPDPVATSSICEPASAERPVTEGLCNKTFAHTEWGELAFDRRRISRRFINVISCEPGTVAPDSGVIDPDDAVLGNCRHTLTNLFIPPVGTWHGRRRLVPEVVTSIDLFPLTNETLTEFASSSAVAAAQALEVVDTAIAELHAMVIATRVPLTPKQVMSIVRFFRLPLQTFRVRQITTNTQGALGVVKSTITEAGNDKSVITIQDQGPVGDEAEAGPSAIPATYIDALGPPGGAEPLAGDAPFFPFPLPGNFVLPTDVYQDETPNVQCAINQCVECAVSNTLAFVADHTVAMKQFFPPLFRGFACDDDDLDYGEAATVIFEECSDEPRFCGDPAIVACPKVAIVDDFARRSDVESFDIGKATSLCKGIRGTFGFIANLRKQALIEDATEFIRFRHQGTTEVLGNVDGGSCKGTAVQPEGLVSSPIDMFDTIDGSSEGGKRVRWEWLFGELSKGRGVHCSHTRYDSLDKDNREKKGGHAWRASCAIEIKLDGKVQRSVCAIDDNKQGTSSPGLDDVRLRVFQLEDDNADGRYNINGGNSELAFCQSMEGIPQTGVPF